MHAPAIFQKAMDESLLSLPNVICYLDNIQVTGTSDHLNNLKVVLVRLKKHGIQLKQSKCSFMHTSVTYLGHKIDASGIHTTAKKVEAIQQVPSPKM